MIRQPQNYWKIGAFVASSGTLLFAAVVWFGTRGLYRDTINAVTYFNESVEGLTTGSPVKFRGVALGKVTEIRFGPNQRDVQVGLEIYFDTLVSLGLRSDRPVPGVPLALEQEGVRVQLSSSGLTGITFLQMDVFDPEQFPARELEFRPPWNHIPSQPSTMKGIEDTVIEALQRIPGMFDDVEATVEKLGRGLDNLDLGALARSAQSIVERTEGLFMALEPGVLRETLENVRATSGSLSLVSDRLASSDGPLEELGRAAKTLSEQVAGALEELDVAGLSAGARTTLDQVGTAAGSLSSGLGGDSGIGADARAELRQLGATLDDLSALLRLLERDPGALLRGRGDTPR